MKNIFTLILAVSFLQLSATQVKKVKSEIKKVTVFLNRAQLVSEVNTELEAGQTEIKITKLPANLDQQSINVAGKGNFTILSVQYNINYIQLTEKTKEAESLEDTITKLDYEITLLNNQFSILDIEEKAIFDNQKIGGHESGLEVKELEKLADFIRERINETRKLKLDITRSLTEKNKNVTKFRAQLNEIQSELNKPTGEITVSVSAKENTDAKLTIEYLVNEAGWYPVYDIRVKNTSEPATLSYKANVFQNTGFEWKNVKMVLSTSNPSSNGIKPELNPWYLNFYAPPVYYNAPRSAAMKKGMAMDDVGGVQKSEMLMEEAAPVAESVSNYTQVTENQLAVSFEIGLPVTVKNGNKEELVEIKTHSLNADYSYSTVPKYDPDAFLLVYIKGWESLNLLAGKANIYFDGAFVGESQINSKQTTDSLAVFLGRDKKITVERKLLKDFTSKKFIGFTKKEEFAYQITVRNTKQEPIDISVEDQLPISQNKEIEVEIQDKGGANYDINSGKLTWPLKLAKGETKTLTFKFSVKYPKGKVVDNL